MRVNEFLFRALIIFVICMSTLIIRYLVPYLKAQIQDTKYAEMLDIVEKAVKAAEQTIRESGQGKAKKAEVISFVSNWLADNNISITEDQLDRLIEAAVYAMNKEK